MCGQSGRVSRLLKLQLRGGPAVDIPRLRAAREAIGPGFPLMQDSNSAYSLPEALTVGYALDELGYHWFEEPLPEQQVENYRYLISKIRTPVLPETVKLTALPLFFANRSMTMARGDVLIKAGITGLRKALPPANSLGSTWKSILRTRHFSMWPICMSPVRPVTPPGWRFTIPFFGSLCKSTRST